MQLVRSIELVCVSLLGEREGVAGTVRMSALFCPSSYESKVHLPDNCRTCRCLHIHLIDLPDLGYERRPKPAC